MSEPRIVKLVAFRGPKVRGRNTNAMVAMSDGTRRRIPREQVPPELIPKRQQSDRNMHRDGCSQPPVKPWDCVCSLNSDCNACDVAYRCPECNFPFYYDYKGPKED